MTNRVSVCARCGERLWHPLEPGWPWIDGNGGGCCGESEISHEPISVDLDNGPLDL